MSEFVEPGSWNAKGKSLDEAIFRGLQELGVSIDEVRIDTIQEGSKGLLGLGAKPFIVRLTTRPIDLSAMEPEKKPRPGESAPPCPDGAGERGRGGRRAGECAAGAERAGRTPGQGPSPPQQGRSEPE